MVLGPRLRADCKHMKQPISALRHWELLDGDQTLVSSQDVAVLRSLCSPPARADAIAIGSARKQFALACKTRPEIIGIVLKPYVAANWDAKTRIARIADHYRTVGEIGGVVDFPSDILIDVIQLTPIDSRYRITLDQARWLLPEGPLVISLWDGVDRIFHLGFCLSTENGRRVAYIGIDSRPSRA